MTTTESSVKVPSQAHPPGYFAGRTIRDLLAAQQAGEIHAEALVRHAADAIARLNPVLNAFAHVDLDAALATARQLDAERAAGKLRGPLHGIPVAIKDNIDVAGMPTTVGSAHFVGHMPPGDAVCVARLRAAGAIILGKAVTHEFAYGSTGDRAVQGPVRNPWRITQMSGGSSAGSAVAVAAGMVPIALGTDTGGSVRVPSALCNLVGFKPSHGRVSAQGVFPLAPSIEDVGVLAHGVEDCRIVMEVMTGGAGTLTVPQRPAMPRVLWVRNAPFAIDDPAVTAIVRTYAERRFGELGNGDAVNARAPALQNVLAAIQKSEAYETHAERIEQAPEKFDPEVLERLQASREVRGWELVRARKTRERLLREFEAIFESADVLALPTVAITAPALNQRLVAGAGVRETLLALTNPWNALGLPAISLPAGFVDGLPVGLQLVAGAGKDAALLALAEQKTR